jgi:hypothetical protein
MPCHLDDGAAPNLMRCLIRRYAVRLVQLKNEGDDSNLGRCVRKNLTLYILLCLVQGVIDSLDIAQQSFATTMSLLIKDPARIAKNKLNAEESSVWRK